MRFIGTFPHQWPCANFYSFPKMFVKTKEMRSIRAFLCKWPCVRFESFQRRFLIKFQQINNMVLHLENVASTLENFGYLSDKHPPFHLTLCRNSVLEDCFHFQHEIIFISSFLSAMIKRGRQLYSTCVNSCMISYQVVKISCHLLFCLLQWLF